MKIDIPCSTNIQPNYSALIQIKDRLGDVIAVCNDAATADCIRDVINDYVDLEGAKEKLLDEMFS